MAEIEKAKVETEFTADTKELDAAAAKLKQIEKASGETLPAETEKGAAKASSAWDGFKGAVNGVRGAIFTVTRALGIVGLAVGAVTAVIAYLRKAQEDQVKATTEAYEKSTDLLRAYDRLEKGGVKLTESQRDYRDALRETNEEMGKQRAEQLTGDIAKLQKKLEGLQFMKEKASKTGFDEYMFTGTPEDYAKRIAGVTLELTKLKVEKEAISGGAKGEDDRTKAQADAAEKERAVKLAGLDGELADLRNNLETRKLIVGQDYLDRWSDLEANIAQEFVAVSTAHAQGLIDEDAYQKAVIDIKKRRGKEAVGIVASSIKEQQGEYAKSIRTITAVVSAGMSSVNESIYKGAESGKITGRQFAADFVKSLGQAMAAAVQVSTIAAAAEALAQPGGPAVHWPEALGVIAWGEAKVAAISALTGAAVGAISGGGGGGGAQPDGGGGNGERDWDTGDSGNGKPSHAIDAVGGGMANVNKVTIINLPMLDGKMAPEAARNIKEALDLRDASLGGEG